MENDYLKDHIVRLEIEEGDNPVKKLIRKGFLITALYVAACIPSSIEVNQRLNESGLPEKFEHVATTAPYKVKDYNMDYGGALDEVLAERKEFLRQNDAFYLGKWLTTRRTTQTPGVSMSGFAVCLNPLRVMY